MTQKNFVFPRFDCRLKPQTQIIKGYKTKSLKDISKYLMILISAGAALWLLYGIIVDDVFIIGTNLAAIALMITVLIMKKRYEKVENH